MKLGHHNQPNEIHEERRSVVSKRPQERLIRRHRICEALRLYGWQSSEQAGMVVGPIIATIIVHIPLEAD